MLAAFLPLAAGPLIGAVGYIAGLSLGIRGRAEVDASDRLGQILAIIAIALNAMNLIWTLVGLFRVAQ